MNVRACIPLIASLALALALAGFVPANASGASPVLVDQTGRAFTLASLKGEPTAITFVSAHCTDACPLIDGQFAAAASKLESARIRARLLTITLDPQHDPPATMRKLAKQFDADPRYWLVASGRPSDVDAVLKEFGVVAKPGPSGYREEHTTFVYVFDSAGKLDTTMLASTNMSDDVYDAMRKLATGSSR